MYGEMGKQSNTLMFLPDKPGDPTALFAQAAAVVREVQHASVPARKSEPSHCGHGD